MKMNGAKMMTINKTKLELFKHILTLDQPSLHDFLYSIITEYYNEDLITECDEFYLYAKGDINVCLIAHLDTVHRFEPKLETIYYDQEKHVMWSPNGIGGDDRCGVFIILNIIMSGLKPHILFTWDEEIGGHGAKFAAKNMNPDVDFLIQFDRRGSKQSVYYDLDCPDFEAYINSFGFETNYGTYTDICEIAPIWGCAAVNLSAGYDNEHTSSEIISLRVLNDTMIKASKILADQLKNPKEFKYTTSTAFNPSSIDLYPCYGCQKLYKWEFLNDLGVCHSCSSSAKSNRPSFYKKVSGRAVPYDTFGQYFD